MKKYKIALTIAGSDPFGAAGIQADLKTFSACGCYGMSVISALVNENSVGVYGVHSIPTDFVIAQIKSIFEDVRPDIIKIGMLYNKELIKAIAKFLLYYDYYDIVLDPVILSTSGDKLLQDEAIDTLKEQLIPLTKIITPNLPEAKIILKENIDDSTDLALITKKLSFNNKTSVLLKGGHFQSKELKDYLYDISNKKIIILPNSKIDTLNTHGTGCSLSSAIASFLAHGLNLKEAVIRAKNYLINAIAFGSKYKIGHGHGPIHHFYNFWE